MGVVKSARKKRNFVKVGSVRIPWWKLGDGRTMIDPPYAVRKVKIFTDHQEALDEAERIATELNAGGVELSSISVQDRSVYAAASAATARHGRELGSAVSEWEDAQRAIAGFVGPERPTLAAVVAAGIAALQTPVHLTGAVAAAAIASKAGHDLDGRYTKDLETCLGDFATAFPGDIAAITTTDIEGWLAARTAKGGKPLGPKRRNDIRSLIVFMFKFARERGFLSDRITAAQQVQKLKHQAGDVEIFTAAEMQILLAHVEEKWLPFLVIAAFSGMRTEEITLGCHAAERKDPLRWEDFDWMGRQIVIRGQTSKTGMPRPCPISDNLHAWLAPWRDKKATGPVVSGSLGKFRVRFKKKLAATAAAMAEKDPQGAVAVQRLIDWPDNALRHSYGSYRMAQILNIQQLSYEMGNSPDIIRRHYLTPRPAGAAAAWFAIFPASHGNTVQFSLPLIPGARV